MQVLLFPGLQMSWVSDWVIEYAVFLHVLAQQWRPRKKPNVAQILVCHKLFVQLSAGLPDLFLRRWLKTIFNCWCDKPCCAVSNCGSCDAETPKERAAREAREKKEKAQELLRKREAEEAAQNLGILSTIAVVFTVLKTFLLSTARQHYRLKLSHLHMSLIASAK